MPFALDIWVTRFINGNPHRGIAYRAVVDVDIPPVTVDFKYTFRPIIDN